jgi:hypothetical protein
MFKGKGGVHLNRVVPSTNTGTDTQSSLLGINPSILTELRSLTIETTATNEVGIVFQDIGTGHDINSASLGESLAGVEGLNAGNFIITLAQ